MRVGIVVAVGMLETSGRAAVEKQEGHRQTSRRAEVKSRKSAREQKTSRTAVVIINKSSRRAGNK